MFALRQISRQSLKLNRAVLSTTCRTFSEEQSKPDVIAPDFSFVNQLTPEQLKPVRMLLDENSNLRRQVGELEALIIAQGQLYEQEKRAKVSAEEVASLAAPSRTEKKRQQMKNMLLVLMATMLVVQSVTAWKNEQVLARTVHVNDEMTENQLLINNEVLSLARLLVKAAPAVKNEKGELAADRMKAIDEKIRLIELKRNVKSE